MSNKTNYSKGDKTKDVDNAASDVAAIENDTQLKWVDQDVSAQEKVANNDAFKLDGINADALKIDSVNDASKSRDVDTDDALRDAEAENSDETITDGQTTSDTDDTTFLAKSTESKDDDQDASARDIANDGDASKSDGVDSGDISRDATAYVTDETNTDDSDNTNDPDDTSSVTVVMSIDTQLKDVDQDVSVTYLPFNDDASKIDGVNDDALERDNDDASKPAGANGDDASVAADGDGANVTHTDGDATKSAGDTAFLERKTESKENVNARYLAADGDDSKPDVDTDDTSTAVGGDYTHKINTDKPRDSDHNTFLAKDTGDATDPKDENRDISEINLSADGDASKLDGTDTNNASRTAGADNANETNTYSVKTNYVNDTEILAKSTEPKNDDQNVSARDLVADGDACKPYVVDANDESTAAGVDYTYGINTNVDKITNIDDTTFLARDTGDAADPKDENRAISETNLAANCDASKLDVTDPNDTTRADEAHDADRTGIDHYIIKNDGNTVICAKSTQPKDDDQNVSATDLIADGNAPKPNGVDAANASRDTGEHDTHGTNTDVDKTKNVDDTMFLVKDMRDSTEPNDKNRDVSTTDLADNDDVSTPNGDADDAKRKIKHKGHISDNTNAKLNFVDKTQNFFEEIEETKSQDNISKIKNCNEMKIEKNKNLNNQKKFNKKLINKQNICEHVMAVSAKRESLEELNKELTHKLNLLASYISLYQSL